MKDSRHLMENINKGYYEKAKQFMEEQELGPGELESLLVEMAHHEGSISIYSFICYLLQQNESSYLHSIAATILSTPLCFIEGAYHSSLYHVRRAMELTPDDSSLMEMILLLNLVPEQVVTKEEALEYAEKILTLDPGNPAALDFLNRAR